MYTDASAEEMQFQAIQHNFRYTFQHTPTGEHGRNHLIPGVYISSHPTRTAVIERVSQSQSTVSDCLAEDLTEAGCRCFESLETLKIKKLPSSHQQEESIASLSLASTWAHVGVVVLA